MKTQAFRKFFMRVDAGEYPAENVVLLDDAGQQRKRRCGFKDFALVDHAALVFPAGWYPEAPGGNEFRRGKRGIEPGVTLRQPGAAGSGEFLVMKPGLREKAEALEDAPLPNCSA